MRRIGGRRLGRIGAALIASASWPVICSNALIAVAGDQWAWFAQR